MIIGIGTDIVAVARLQRDLDRFGERFAARILTDEEMQEFRANARPANFLARRFAAKEATAKALRTGIAGGLTFRQIGVAHETSGCPRLVFTGYAKDLIKCRSVDAVHISISDERDYAVAFVTLESAPR
jgi:holo-[acyl-carrier protein] synthase